MPIDTHLKNKLEELDQIYGDDEMYRILGPTLLSYTSTYTFWMNLLMYKIIG